MIRSIAITLILCGYLYFYLLVDRNGGEKAALLQMPAGVLALVVVLMIAFIGKKRK